MARSRRPFDASDKAAAELQLRAKFEKTDAEDLIHEAHAFVLMEGDPFDQYLNDKRLERFDEALKVLIAALDELPDELRDHAPPEPRPEHLPKELRELLEKTAREVDFSEESILRGFHSDKTEAERIREVAYQNAREARQLLGLVPLNQFRNVLTAWRAALRIEGNEPDPKDPYSILAAQSVRVRFAVELAFVRDGRRDPFKPLPELSGRDLALLAIASELETHRAGVDFGALVDAWKKTRSRAMQLVKQFDRADDVLWRRRRAARRAR